MQKDKKELLEKLYKRDGRKCHYCEIPEKLFSELWGEFYGLGWRGTRLEIDRKHAVVREGKDIKKRQLKYTPKNCVLACALCNMAKSDMFTPEEFHKVGKVIEEIWRERQRLGLKVR